MGLFDSYKIKNLELKNKLVMPPMCTYQSFNHDGKVTSFHCGHYISRAIGQVGLIIMEATAVLPNGRITDNDLGIYNDEHIEPLKEIVDGAHLQGSKIAIQISHAGRKSTTSQDRHVGPSAVKYNEQDLDYEALSLIEIDEVIRAFKDAARRAHLAGFDALEIHGAHGYLVHEFISPLSNFRDDEYGKDRFLFLKNIVKEIKSVWPNDKALFLRISANDFIDGGLKVEDWISFLNENPDLVDMIHVSSGGIMGARIELYPGYQLDYAKAIREQTSYPVIGVGLINDSDMIHASLDLGYCDLVATGRELLRDPNLFIKLAFESGYDYLIPEYLERAFRRRYIKTRP